MKAVPIEIAWHPGLPIFASEPFLKAVSDEYGWLGGIDNSGKCRCILPYTIVHKFGFRMVRFRVETIPLVDEFGAFEEKSFLTSAMEYFRSIGADVVIPATTNAVFRTYPDEAVAAPYGSYVVDLLQSEDLLWRNIYRVARQNINAAVRNGVVVRAAGNEVDAAYLLVSETFRRSKLPFMNHESFLRYMDGLGPQGRIMVAEHQGIAQSYVVLAFSLRCAYAIYAGNVEQQQPGANKLLYWEAIRYFRSIGVQKFDFVGARINPTPGSKQDGINLLKKHFGATLKQGYMWKYPLRPLRSRVYTYGVKLLRGGDIVDAEHHKLTTESLAA